MTALLARYADAIFWLARYVERAENLARLLDVQETFARDSRGGSDWSVVLRINSDSERFFQVYERADVASVLSFYLIDRGNPTSIASNLHAARENARVLRPLISTEMWTHLNVFYNRVLVLQPRDVAPERLNRVCSLIKEGCDTHAGITEGTFYRDEAWCFYRMGAAIELADQTTRLLDAKLLGFQARDDDPGSAADISYWTALLRAAAGYQAFRRHHTRGMTPEQVTTFLLGDPNFPRSVACNLAVVQDQLTRLRRQYGLRKTGPALEELDDLIDQLELRKIKVALRDGAIHGFNDHVQGRLAALTDHLATAFFGYGTAPAQAQSDADADEQGTQTQSIGGMTQTQRRH